MLLFVMQNSVVTPCLQQGESQGMRKTSPPSCLCLHCLCFLYWSVLFSFCDVTREAQLLQLLFQFLDSPSFPPPPQHQTALDMYTESACCSVMVVLASQATAGWPWFDLEQLCSQRGSLLQALCVLENLQNRRLDSPSSLHPFFSLSFHMHQIICTVCQCQAERKGKTKTSVALSVTGRENWPWIQCSCSHTAFATAKSCSPQHCFFL